MQIFYGIFGLVFVVVSFVVVLNDCIIAKLEIKDKHMYLQKQSFRRRSENMQQTYRKTLMSKCDFNKVKKRSSGRLLLYLEHNRASTKKRHVKIAFRQGLTCLIFEAFGISALIQRTKFINKLNAWSW